MLNKIESLSSAVGEREGASLPEASPTGEGKIGLFNSHHIGLQYQFTSVTLEVSSFAQLDARAYLLFDLL